MASNRRYEPYRPSHSHPHSPQPQQAPNYSMPLGRPKSPGSPLRYDITFSELSSGPFSDTSSEDTFLGQEKEHDDGLPARYIGPEMRRASVSVRERTTSFRGHTPRSRGGGKELRRWLPEVIWLCMSFVLVIGITVLLRIYDRKEAPVPALHVSVALMTALAQFAYMVPLIAALGQLRWLRARDPRTLSEFVALDQAARGYANILPALLGRGGIMAVVGGLLIVLGLLVFPATQQAIGYRTGLVPGQETATAARLVSLTEGHDIIGDWRKAAALQQAVLGSSASSKTSGGITCPTGDCAFPLFTSLAVCSRTSNITSMLTVGREPDQRWTGTNSTTTYSGTLPGGLSLVTPNRASLGFGVPSSPRPVSDKSPALVLLDLYAVYTTPGPDERNAPTFSAAEVVFSWCIQQISADVSAGVVTLATTPIDGTLVGDGGRNVSLAAQFQSAGNARNTTICLPGAEPQSSACSHGVNVTLRTTTETDQDELFTIGQVQSLRLSRTLAQIFGGIDRPIPRGGDFFIPTDSSDNSLLQLDGNTASLMAAKFATTIFNTTATVPSDSSRAGEGIQTTAETIASSISHLLRTDPSAAEDVTGTTLTHSTIIAVTWPWLSFIVAEVVGVALFLTIVAIQTRRADIPVLKTDTLATMLALDGDVRKVLGAAVATAGEMRDWAGRLNVVLERDMESGRNHNGGGPVSLAAVKDAAFASLTFAGGSRGWVRVK